MVNSSAAGSLAELYVNRLRERDEITDGVGANKLIKAWPPAHKEWTTKAVRDAFFSWPSLPRLLNPNAIRRTIADGVNQKLIAYARKVGADRYDPIVFEPDTGLVESDIEVSDEMVILRAVDAKLLREPPRLTTLAVHPTRTTVKPGGSTAFTATGHDQHGHVFENPELSWSATGGEIDQNGRFVAGSTGIERVRASAGIVEAVAEVRVVEAAGDIGSGGNGRGGGHLKVLKGFGWTGVVPHLKWMSFYTKVLSSLVTNPGLKLEVRFEVTAGESVNEAKIEATKAALHELGLSDDVEIRFD